MTFELTLSSIFLRGLAFLAITALHGLFLAGAARLLGDKGPGYDGRLHAGPFGHLDVLGMVTAVLTLWGWIRPMRIDAPELKSKCLRLREAGFDARHALEALAAKSRRIQLTRISGDKYFGRIVADVMLLDGRNVSDDLLLAGLVQVYDGGRKPREICSTD